MIWYTLLVLAVGLERLAELVVSKRNAAWSLAHGGVETGQRHYVVMVVLHTGLLVGCLVEVWWRRPTFIRRRRRRGGTRRMLCGTPVASTRDVMPVVTRWRSDSQASIHPTSSPRCRWNMSSKLPRCWHFAMRRKPIERHVRN